MLEDVPATENVPAVYEAKTASAVAEQAALALCPAPTDEQAKQIEEVSAELDVR